jgi:23S rRNA pseudouridine955/2504/2580 synthase
VKKFTIGANDAGQRLDKFAVKASSGLPLPLLHKAIRKRDVKINRRRCYCDTVLREGDVVEFYLDGEFFPPGENLEFLNASKNFPHVYEDGNIIIAEKPAGLLSHGAEGDSADNLVNRLKKYLYGKGEYLPERENSFAPAICSRLDRNTGGLVLCAKNAAALREANRLLQDGYIEKYYIALLSGRLEQPAGLIEGALSRDGGSRKSYVSQEGKASKSAYKLLAVQGGNSLAEVRIFTGRTHQIRAHFAATGHPIAGDAKYGGKALAGFRSQALYSYRLKFNVSLEHALSYLNGKEFFAENLPGWAASVRIL